MELWALKISQVSNDFNVKRYLLLWFFNHFGWWQDVLLCAMDGNCCNKCLNCVDVVTETTNILSFFNWFSFLSWKFHCFWSARVWHENLGAVCAIHPNLGAKFGCTPNLGAFDWKIWVHRENRMHSIWVHKFGCKHQRVHRAQISACTQIWVQIRFQKFDFKKIVLFATPISSVGRIEFRYVALVKNSGVGN